MKKIKKKPSNKVSIINKKASFSYQLLDQYTAGIVLKGAEIKSIRMGRSNIKDGYCYFANNELFSKGIHISPYKPASYANHPPDRNRKLLLRKKELVKMKREKEEKGYTIIPLRLFIDNKGFAKLEIALAKGKKMYDKRASIKERELKRSVRETLTKL